MEVKGENKTVQTPERAVAEIICNSEMNYCLRMQDAVLEAWQENGRQDYLLSAL